MRALRDRPWRALLVAALLLAVFAPLAKRLAYRFGLLARSAGPPNVLWLVLDGTRAEHLSVYGYERLTSPWLARLAAEGVVFESATVGSPWPVANHLEMVTGRRLAGEATVLPEGAVTAAGAFRAAGYETGLIVGALPLDSKSGFAQGFDAVMAGPPMLFFADASSALGLAGAAIRTGLVSPERALRWLDRSSFDAGLAARASGATDRALRWIAGREPFFLLIDYTDPLAPLDPPEPQRSRFADGVPPIRGFLGWEPGERSPQEQSAYAAAALPRLRAEERQELVDLYDAEIAFLDAQIGRLVEALRYRGRLDDTIVVVSGDRGDLLSELDSPPARELRVPLLVRHPARLPAGARVGAPVALRDVLPTLLDWTGLPRPGAMDGESFAARIGRADAVAPSPDQSTR